MFRFVKPCDNFIQLFRNKQAGLDFSYPDVGATQRQPPKRYVVDHTHVLLGNGKPIYEAAKSALKRWKQFDLKWTKLYDPETPIEVGSTVAMLAQGLFGIWSLNACRIVYTIDEDGPTARFGFAYGTLPDHVGTGEERFLVEWNRDDDSVWYDILAFSRPHQLLGKLFYPYLRRKQLQFKTDSAAAMQHAVNEMKSERE